MKRRTCRVFGSNLLAVFLLAFSVFELRTPGAEPATDEVVSQVKPDPVVALPEAQAQERQVLHQAIDDLRQQLNTSSRQILDQTVKDAEALSQNLRQQLNTSSKQILDQTSKDAETLSQKVQETLSARLDLIERTMAQSQQRELDALRSANKTFLTLAGLFAGLGVLGILIAALILSRSINHFSEVALSLPGAGRTLAAPPDRAALGPGELGSATPAQFEQVNARFNEALEHLEKRIREMESWGQPVLGAADHNGSDNGSEPLEPKGASPLKQIASALETSSVPAVSLRGPRSEASMLLGKGQALLNLGQAEEALGCFDQAIALDPRNAEAFVKRGMAMERLQKMDQAIENYDRAIAVNDSFTLAYLYKGAVCNKLQRFQEALDCYERALRSEQTTVTP